MVAVYEFCLVLSENNKIYLSTFYISHITW